jgi:hypothetical protein
MISTWGAAVLEGPTQRRHSAFTPAAEIPPSGNSLERLVSTQKDGEVLRISSPAARFLQFRL